MKTFRHLFLFGLFLLGACAAEVPPAADHTIYNINCDLAIPDDHKVPMVFQVLLPDTVVAYPGRIERRGGYSISFPKASFEIDLEEDISLAGLPADDDWILNANYIDKTFLRHVFSYDLFRAMDAEHEAARCRYVELRLNGSYQGLYVLMEKLDKSSLGISRRDPTACIFKEPPVFIPDLENFRPQYDDNYYQQTYPDKGDDDRTDFIEEVRDFLSETPDSIFSARVGAYFDLPNIIDWHLLLLLSNNSDGLKKNFYLYKKSADTPLRVAPWDYDHSFGRDGDNEKNLSRWIDCRRSLLLSRLLDQPFYRRALRDRWEELNAEGLLSLPALVRRVERYQSILRPLVVPNFERWPVGGPVYYDNSDYEAEVELFKSYLELRHGQLFDYFGG